MAGQYVAQEIVAIVLETAGAFLLAVEAIKLDNLKKFREAVFANPVRFLTPSIWVARDATKDEVAKATERKILRIMPLLALAGALAICLLLWLAGATFQSVATAVASAAPDGLGARVLAGLVVLLCGFFASAFVGFLVYRAVLLPFEIPLRVLELIEKKTATGGIGITGFVLILISSIAHIVIKLAS